MLSSMCLAFAKIIFLFSGYFMRGVNQHCMFLSCCAILCFQEVYPQARITRDNNKQSLARECGDSII